MREEDERDRASEGPGLQGGGPRTAVDVVLFALLHELEVKALAQQALFTRHSVDASDEGPIVATKDQARLVQLAHNRGRHAEATWWLMSIRELRRQLTENSQFVRAMIDHQEEGCLDDWLSSPLDKG